MDDHDIAFIFPGQGSQSVGMGRSLAMEFHSARELFEQADHILNYPLSNIAWEGPEETLNDTVNTQPAIFTHSIAVLQVIHQLNLDLIPCMVAGHSMGELSALVAAGGLSFADGLKLVKTRGELMKRAGEQNPGGMAAVLGLDIPTIDQICADASQAAEVVQVANDNCPGQTVISGSNSAMDRVIPMLEQAGAKRVIRLAVSIAAHSPLMKSAQDAFNDAVAATPIKPPFIPTIGNVSAYPLIDGEAIRDDLQKQLTHRVRWTESVRYMVSQGVKEFVEIGNGSVLNGLVKRIDRSIASSSLGAPDDFHRFETH